MKRLVFRFDVDTHKCIRDGVPRLLEISNKYDVPFTFFLNMGKSISIKDSLKNLLSQNKEEISNKIPQMMSAFQKLGMKDYLIAAVINPNISNYKIQIEQLLGSKCEVGLHGGRNHATWANTVEWSEEDIKDELQWALGKLKDIDADYKIKGFASPEWKSKEGLSEILKELGFVYCGDMRCLGEEPINRNDELLKIGVNLLGEPGGVAFFENCRVKGMTDDEIIEMVLSCFSELDTVVLYDHPYYAGIREIECIARLIEKAKNAGIQICKLEELM